MIYFLLAFSSFCYAVCDISFDKKLNKANILLSDYIFFIFISILILLGSIRWQRGTDWDNYYNFFTMNRTWKQFNSGFFEFSYSFLNYIVHSVYNSYSFFLFIFTFFVISLKFKVIKSIALFPAFSLFLYICQNFGDIFAVRQTLSISILWMSIVYIHRKEKLKFFLVVLLATTFHNASLFWIFAYYIYHKDFKVFALFSFLIIFILLGLFDSFKNLFFIVSEYVSGYLQIDNRIISKILLYSANSEIIQPSMMQSMISLSKRIIVVPFIIVLKYKLKETNEYMRGIINLYITGSVFSCLFLRSFVTLQRFSIPYTFLEIFIVPSMLYIIKRKEYKYLFLFVILVYGFLKLFFSINSYRDLFLPYYTVFDF
jgi:hypothetical protein